MNNHTGILGIAVGAVLALSAGLAAAEVSHGTYTGKSTSEVRQQLEGQGYHVQKIETDDGYLEAYAVLNGKRYEIKVDPRTGKVIRIERED
ncbi:MAG: PepSY domain-containing protein [Hyphomicrobiales bacterium]|nr:PepSY domain-containing protein [Hyphomicrobiales bacterium]